MKIAGYNLSVEVKTPTTRTEMRPLYAEQCERGPLYAGALHYVMAVHCVAGPLRVQCVVVVCAEPRYVVVPLVCVSEKWLRFVVLRAAG